MEIIEAIATASFSGLEGKSPYIRLSIKKIDALKILIMILWESKSLDDKRYIAVSIKLDEIGRNLGGWQGQVSALLLKQNSLAKDNPRQREK